MFKSFRNTKNLIFLIIAILCLVFLSKIVGIVLLFFAAFIIAAALNPYVNKLESKMNRGLATAIVVLSGIFSVIALFLPIFFMAYKEIKVFVTFLPQKLELLTNFLLNFRLQEQGFSELLDLNSILGSTTNIARNVFSQSLNFTMGFASACVVTVAIMMIVFYLLVDKTYIRAKFLEFFPPDLKDKASEILTTITNRVGSYVRAQILSMLAVGLMVMFVLAMLGVEYPLLLGLISGILEIIPILGPTIAIALILLVAAQLGWIKIIFIVVAFLAVQQISNYIVRPFLFGKFMSLHPLMVFFSLFVAQQFLGVFGVILSPAIAATICVLVDELYLKQINKDQDIE